MRAFVAGASGFLGRSICRALVAAGYEVRGLHRSPEGAHALSALGVRPLQGTLSDASFLGQAVEGCDVVVHAASAHPVMSLADPLSVMRQVRVEGGRNLLAAATRHRVRRFLAISGYWVYGDHPGPFTEESAKSPRFLSQVNFEVENVAREAQGTGAIEAVIVQPGMVYGNGSWFKEMVGEIRQGTFRYIGEGKNHWSLVHLFDLGEAVRLLCEKGRPGEEYLVVDDAPIPVKDLADRVAKEIGVPRPTGMPLTQAVKEMGADLTELNSNNQQASNAKLKALGWRPKYPTQAEGLPSVLSEMTG